MYESMTYESILQRMLGRVPGNVDKREGSILYDALAPAAAELTQMYIELDVILNETFADTAGRQYLIKRAAERGIIPSAATKAILKAEFNIDVPIGSRFSMDHLNYTATEKITDGEYKVQCESTGSEGNRHFGTLIPIDYIDGLSRAELTELLIPGEDEEETEHLRARYYNSLMSQAFGGNITDYKEKVNAIAGIGGVKVYPVWDGGGTVKLVLITSAYQQPSQELIDTVQAVIDPLPNQGQGYGIVPIGHKVTVVGAAAEAVKIQTQITCNQGWSWEDVQPYAEAVIDDYFLELAKTWADNNNLVVRISQLETRLLGLAGILDIAQTRINDLEENLILKADSIPVRGELIV